MATIDALQPSSEHAHLNHKCSDSNTNDDEFEDASENLSTTNSTDSGHDSQPFKSTEIINNKSESSSSSGASSSTHSDDDYADGDLDHPQPSTPDNVEEQCPTLDESLKDIDRLLHLALDNRFKEAYDGTEKWSKFSLYHALGQATLSFLKGCLTLERPEIQKALENLKNCLDVCQLNKRSSMTKFVWRPNYNYYTDVEIHAELCNAETLLMTALLTFLEDQNLLNLVRGAFRIRACYQSYKECFYILNNRTEWSSDYSRLHFESGVRMGIGTFNLMLSHMPSKVLKLLEFVGFSGNRQQGLKELELSSSQLKNGLRRPLATLIMLAYQCYIEHIFGLGDGDMKCVDRCLEYGLNRHPNGAFFLLFLGRKKQLTGKILEAIEAFEKCISVQNEWKQFHNICYWELLWCYAVQCDWNNAAQCADILRKQCKWSPGAYTYQYATFLYMIMQEQNRPELLSEISELLHKVPELRIRFAGKTIPAEKFAIVQSEKYFRQSERLCLPAIEYMYIWNIFAVIGQSEHLLNPILNRIEQRLIIEEEAIKQSSHEDGDTNSVSDSNSNYFLDDYCRCLLLKGMCLRYLRKNLESNQCFLKVIDYKNQIQTDNYLIPMATLELALNFMNLKKFSIARKWLDNAKQYSGYTLETIVHFRIHTALRTMNNQTKSTATTMDDPESDLMAVDLQEEADSTNGSKKSNGSIRNIWNELSRRLTFSDTSRHDDEDEDDDPLEDDQDLQDESSRRATTEEESKTKF